MLPSRSRPPEFLVTVERDSVSTGDDCTAPNGFTLSLPPDATLGDVESALAIYGAWVSVHGGHTTWALRGERDSGTVMAVLTCQPVSFKPIAPLTTPIKHGAVLYLSYLLNQDPDATVELIRDQPERMDLRLP